MDISAIHSAHLCASEHLLAQRDARGHWRGRLSSSALSTATATFALAAVDAQAHAPVIHDGLKWLMANQNSDGGWGDTPQSPSNISTTLLAWSALWLSPRETWHGRPARVCQGHPGPGSPTAETCIQKAEGCIQFHAGSLCSADIASAVTRAYGGDRTFSAPILAMCAMAGRLENWQHVAPLPYELAVTPQSCLKWLRLPVVSYALPALIAIGIAIEHHRPSVGPLAWLRRRVRDAALRKLQAIQPTGGGFLEAAPLTSFVAMSLARSGLKDHPVAAKCAEFLARTVRPDGSWPIDTDLATWVTTLSLSALGPTEDHARAMEWLLAQQSQSVHPYTAAAPGGWGWTDLPGAVCDADDTAGALLAIARCWAWGSDKKCHDRDANSNQIQPRGQSRAHPQAPKTPLEGATHPLLPAARAGVKWLLGLQNRDGGIPTFCRGWGKLPFDHSSPDLTAHALRAWSAWQGALATDANLAAKIKRGMRRAISYLQRSQRPDGSWVPLWFGNQAAPNQENPTYGTSRVVLALAELDLPAHQKMLSSGVEWLLRAQNADGSWGGAPGVPGTVEETALAVEALASLPVSFQSAHTGLADSTIRIPRSAIEWLLDRTGGGRHFTSSPIGLYFARLWYDERLYPVIFTTAALRRVLLMER